MDVAFIGVKRLKCHILPFGIKSHFTDLPLHLLTLCQLAPSHPSSIEVSRKQPIQVIPLSQQLCLRSAGLVTRYRVIFCLRSPHPPSLDINGKHQPDHPLLRMGIARDSRHKRSASGARRAH